MMNWCMRGEHAEVLFFPSPSLSSQNLLSSDNVADVFHLQTVSVATDQSVSRTFYMTASSNEERDAWVEAISNNLRAYSVSPPKAIYSTAFE